MKKIHNKTDLFTGLSLFGFASTSFLICWGYNKKKKSKKKRNYIYFIPAIFTGGLTVISILSINRESKKVYNALADAYAITASSLYRYKKSMYENMQEVSADKIASESIEKCFDKNRLSSLDSDLGDNCLFIEEHAKVPFACTMEDYYRAVAEMNERFIKNGYVGVDELYSILNLPVPKIAKDFGWSSVIGSELGYSWIDFNLIKRELDDGTTYYLIHYLNEPLFYYWNNSIAFEMMEEEKSHPRHINGMTRKKQLL